MSTVTSLTSARGWVTPPVPGPAAGWSPGGRIAAAVALVAAGVLQTAQEVIEPDAADPAARFAAMAREPRAFEYAQAVGIAALPFLAAATLVLLLLARHRATRLAWFSGCLATAGVVGLAVAHGLELAETAALREGVDVATVQRVDDASLASPAAVPVVVLFLGLVLGLLLQTVAMWRAAVAPRGALVLVVVFLAADFGLLGSWPVPVHGVLLLAFAWIAWSLLQTPRTAPEHTGR
jgi:hypothetical protein